MEENTDYRFYTADDFYKDEYFIRWVVSPDAETEQFWQGFLKEHPGKNAEIQLAALYIRNLRFREAEPHPADLKRLKAQITHDLALEEVVVADGKKGKIRWYPARIGWVAAVLLFFLGAAGFWLWQENSGARVTYETRYGEIREFILPDSTVVTLNSNSRLLQAGFGAGVKTREVWLSGEGYFKVAHDGRSKFVVHTPEASVEVLGTEFNVKARGELTYVVLEQGSVKVQAKGKPETVMKPGEMVTVNDKEGAGIRLETVKTELHNAWKKHWLVMDGMPVWRLVEEIRDTYGVDIAVNNEEMRMKKLSGKLNTASVNDLVEDLSVILGASYSVEDSRYRLD